MAFTDMGVQVELGIGNDDQASYVDTRPPPTRGWVISKGNYYDYKADRVNADNPNWSYDCSVIENADCGWYPTGYRWRLRKLKEDGEWETTTGTWPPGARKIDFHFDERYGQQQYKVVATFGFIGSGLLMCDNAARRLLTDGATLILNVP